MNEVLEEFAQYIETKNTKTKNIKINSKFNAKQTQTAEVYDGSDDETHKDTKALVRTNSNTIVAVNCVI